MMVKWVLMPLEARLRNFGMILSANGKSRILPFNRIPACAGMTIKQSCKFQLVRDSWIDLFCCILRFVTDFTSSLEFP
jgi:hypothetical protein